MQKAHNYAKNFAMQRTFGPMVHYPQVESYIRQSKEFIVIAGPCSLESEKQINEIAALVKKQGATHLRSGVFRAGTYPGKNFGLIPIHLINEFHKAAHANGLKNIIEVLDYSERSLNQLADLCDCFQIGARQMQNYTLLKKLSQYKRQVFIKRNPGSTMDELLGACEYLLSGNCEPVIIERGSSSFMNHVRWDLSISIIPAIKSICEIPVIVDASHGTGRRDLVEPMTMAGVAAGAAGLLCEVHTEPDKSLSDAEQAISPEAFEVLMKKVTKVREAIK
jgi:3-deoxy-7-phosphoheptulonate synthase